MENILFEHNQKAYQAAVEMLAQTGRAAVIHPTGTGKSFIAFQLCVDNEKSKVCFLSPSEYIFKTQLEKWSAAGGKELKNIEFITYARLMRMSGDDLEEIRPDYIILDEFHRCGAAQWGGGVERLREMYPEAKVLGLSATNVRYLDNQRDMAWELFDGNIASELTLGAAVVQGILPAPKYVLSVYSYQKELKRYELRVRQARNKAVRDKAEQELEALRRALEKADGLEDVFARHMLAEDREDKEAKKARKDKEAREDREARKDWGAREDREAREDRGAREDREAKCQLTANQKMEISGGKESSVVRKAARQAVSFGRYIVFCASYEHLIEMRELAPEWFAKVDSAPHIYTAYSDDPATSAEFEAFKADTSGHLKLLYCIDMLNEGIHVDGVDGVILLRPTVSPTIYKQQIGRALAAGGKKTPMIFDIVMNIENLCSIGGIEEELRSAVLFCRANGRGDAVVQEHFRVIDELGDCRRLFAQLNETLGASWDAMYTMAREYYAEHGNLEIPVKYATVDGYSLGAWVVTQRKVYLGKVAGNLSGEQICKLSAIGMHWQGTQEVAWERNFAEAEKYFKEHGDLCVPADYVAESGCKLGRWVRRQREKYQGFADRIEKNEGSAREIPDKEMTVREGNAGASDGSQRFHQQRMERLAQIGMVWENIDPWEKKFLLVKRYYEENGSLKMPADYVVEGVWLERWLREQKARLEEGAAILENSEEILPQRNVSEALSEDGCETDLQEGDILQADAFSQHARRLRTPLTEYQKQKLLSLGIQPGVSQAEISWREQYGEAEEFYRRHGNLSIPKRYAAGNGKNLRVWLQHQRAGRRQGKLSAWQVAMLDGIGMVWESADAWETGFAHAQEYFRANGHLEVPNHYVCVDGYRLGRWISNQRYAYGKGAGKNLDGNRARRLEGLGMVWSAKQGKSLEARGMSGERKR